MDQSRCLLNIAVLIATICQVQLVATENRFESDGAILRQSSDGEKQLSRLTRYGEHPKYGKCWTRALERIEQGCKRLTDDEQSYLALSFANCHLEKAGHKTYPCPDTTPVHLCLQQLNQDVIAFNAYTEFFTHTQDICFFLQSQVWHEQTEETVNRIAKSSEDVAVKMEATGHLQEEMMQKQGESLVQQTLILQNEEKLREELQTSSLDIKSVFAEMKESTQSQKRLFEETFTRVADVQRVILGEFTWFNSLLFFAAAILVAYMITSTPRTSGARLWLFVVLVVDLAMERVVCQWSDNDQTVLYRRMWLCRKCCCVAAGVVLCVVFYRYKDFNIVNNRLLLEIKQQNSQLCQALQGIGDHIYPALNGGVPLATGSSSLAAKLSLVGFEPKRMLMGGDYADASRNRRTEDISRVDAYSSDDFSSTDSDASYSASDSESFTTATHGSRRVSLDQEQGGGDHETEVEAASVSGTARRQGRPKGSKNHQASSQKATPIQTRYNLRTRHDDNANNPVLNTETVEMFVNRMGVAFGPRNIRAEQVNSANYSSSQRRNITSFSSDDDY